MDALKRVHGETIVRVPNEAEYKFVDDVRDIQEGHGYMKHILHTCVYKKDISGPLAATRNAEWEFVENIEPKRKPLYIRMVQHEITRGEYEALIDYSGKLLEDIESLEAQILDKEINLRVLNETLNDLKRRYKEINPKPTY